jgi:ribonuclease HII
MAMNARNPAKKVAKKILKKALKDSKTLKKAHRKQYFKGLSLFKRWFCGIIKGANGERA